MKDICPLVLDLLPLYLDGVCSPETTVIIEEHLKTCDSCREAHEQFRQIGMALDRLEPPKDDDTRLEASLKAVKRKISRRTRIVVTCAALVVAILLGTVFGVLRWQDSWAKISPEIITRVTYTPTRQTGVHYYVSNDGSNVITSPIYGNADVFEIEYETHALSSAGAFSGPRLSSAAVKAEIDGKPYWVAVVYMEMTVAQQWEAVAAPVSSLHATVNSRVLELGLPEDQQLGRGQWLHALYFISSAGDAHDLQNMSPARVGEFLTKKGATLLWSKEQAFPYTVE